MQIQAEVLRRVAADIRGLLGNDFDDQTFLDTLDGETDAMDMIGHLITAKVEADEMEEAMKRIAASYQARANRFAAQADASRTGLAQILDAIGQTKVKHILGAVFRTKARLSLAITDASAIPSQLCRHTPDAAAIKASIEAGEPVPGAEMRLGLPGLTVRVR